jgi:peptidoglycan/LPS O-acetylase OafA/YrhL
MLITMFPLRNAVANFFSAKTIGTYIMVMLIPTVFYSYTTFTGESIFAIDIATFVVAVIIGQFVSYKLYRYRRLPKPAETIAIVAIILLVVVFIVFTFYPPHLPIFQDPITGHYGAKNL